METLCRSCRWAYWYRDQNIPGPFPAWCLCKFPGVVEPSGIPGTGNYDWPEIVTACTGYAREGHRDAVLRLRHQPKH